jgi:ATP-dependent helicase HrpA
MRHEAGHVTEDLFPPTLQLDGSEYQLAYRFEHGHALDGVTITVPLAALNQISAARCEWLVPGLLREKVTFLVRALPHKLRSACVPVPDFVTAALLALTPGNYALSDALATFIKSARGLVISADVWAEVSLPEHLRMNFRIIDGDQRELAAGRELDTLREELGGRAEHSFGAALSSEIEREGITTWDFGDLPEKMEFQRHGQKLTGYPALAEQGGQVALRLFDTPTKAEQAMGGGLARLLLLQLPEQARFVEKSLPVSKEMCLHYLPLGSCDELKRALQQAVAVHVLIDGKPWVRNAAEFAQRRDQVRSLVVSGANQLCKLAAEILAEYHALNYKLQSAKTSSGAIADMKTQLEHLLHPGFLADTPISWLRHYPRYLKAMSLRLAKLPAAAARDSQQMAELAPHWHRCLEKVAQLEKKGEAPSLNLQTYRWMIEELRVSLFAQELKTIQPVSAKRLEKQWESIVKG